MMGEERPDLNRAEHWTPGAIRTAPPHGGTLRQGEGHKPRPRRLAQGRPSLPGERHQGTPLRQGNGTSPGLTAGQGLLSAGAVLCLTASPFRQGEGHKPRSQRLVQGRPSLPGERHQGGRKHRPGPGQHQGSSLPAGQRHTPRERAHAQASAPARAFFLPGPCARHQGGREPGRGPDQHQGNPLRQGEGHKPRPRRLAQGRPSLPGERHLGTPLRRGNGTSPGLSAGQGLPSAVAVRLMESGKKKTRPGSAKINAHFQAFLKTHRKNQRCVYRVTNVPGRPGHRGATMKSLENLRPGIF